MNFIDVLYTVISLVDGTLLIIRGLLDLKKGVCRTET
jgi:hypothetical protein